MGQKWGNYGTPRQITPGKKAGVFNNFQKKGIIKKN